MPTSTPRPGALARVRALLLAVSLAALAPFAAAQDLVINEFLSNNRGGLPDEDGEYEDWIELHNRGASAVDLSGHGLSDNAGSPFKWVFPAVTIEPGAFLLVRATEKNRDGVPVPGLVRELFTNAPGSTLDDLFSIPDFPEFPAERSTLTGGFEALSDIGDNYGQRLRGFVIPPTTGDYTFWIACDDSGQLLLSPDDDPTRAVPICSVSGYTAFREWDKYGSQQSAAIPLVAGRRYAIIAQHKEGSGGDHLSVRWRLPNGTFEAPVPASRLETARGELHASFKISGSGEALFLTAPDGTLLDSTPEQALPGNVSYGRRPDAPDTWAYFAEPTPGAANTTPVATATLPPPEFSAPGGFYTAGFSLTLGSPDPEATVIYSIDGSEPLPSRNPLGTYTYKAHYPTSQNGSPGPRLTGSMRTQTYTAPIAIADRSGHANKLSIYNTTYDQTSSNYAPTSLVFKGTVVRARLIKDGALPGPVVTHTYFVTPTGRNRYPVPVVSLALDDEALFGFENGLYVAGEDFERWRLSTGANASPPLPANYNRRGPSTEKPVHFELFTPADGRVVGQNLGVRLHGGWSRAFPMKTLRFYAHEAYDAPEWLNHPLIPGRTALGTGEPVTAYRRFLLRNSGNDFTTSWNGLGATMMRDALIQEVAAPLRLDRQGYQPAVHFINGEFWGIINLRERVDRFFIQTHHGADPDDVAILNNDAIVEEGLPSDRDDFLALREYVRLNDMSRPEHYAYAEARMDMDNFIRYSVAQIYSANTDWPQNNVDFWRVRTPNPTPGAPAGQDGRWRWILFDLDLAFANASHDTFAHALTPRDDWSRVLLAHLLDNPAFRARFINTFADHLQTTFAPARVIARVDSMQAALTSIYSEHGSRWRNSGSTSAQFLKNFGGSRASTVRSQLMTRFGLSSPVNITFNTADPARGHLVVNTLTLRPGEPALPDPAAPLPWTGAYFPSVPITVRAVPEPGHRFTGWVELPGETSATLTVTPAQGLSLTATFEALPPAELLHYWNFNNTAALLAPTLARGAAALSVAPGPDTETTSGTGQNFAAANAQNEDAAAAHLRINNPLGATLALALPTTGYFPPVVRFETRRSGQGAGTQQVDYTLDGGASHTPFATLAPPDGTPLVVELDFAAVAGAADNPGFGLRITFAQSPGGIAGNNRFDNLTVHAVPDPSVNLPPALAAPLGLIVVREGLAAPDLDLAPVFTDPEGAPLSFTAAAERPAFATATVLPAAGPGAAPTLRLVGLRRGETEVLLEAHDGVTDPVPHRFRVLVLPAPHRLADGPYALESWDPATPELTYPASMLFLQGAENDATLSTALDHAYFVPEADYASGDLPKLGFPYDLASRTRLNGLGADGFSFINTGRGRDLGGALLALDTRDVAAARVAWTAGTLTPNIRVYAIRLQYRLAPTQPWTDFPGPDAQPVEYLRSETAGADASFDVALPPDLLGQPELELLWRYHHVSGTSGARAQLRVDDIRVGPPAGPSFSGWAGGMFTPEELADPAVSGPAADPRGTGVPNLLRYALGLGLDDEAGPSLPRLLGGDAGAGGGGEGGSLVFTFPYAGAPADLAYVVEASGDLVDWSEVRFDSRMDPEPRVVDGWAEFDLPAPDGAAPRRFYRLRVILAP